MQKLLLSILSLFIAFSITSCYYDHEEYLYGSGCDTSLAKGPLFTQVESLIQSQCIGCHNASNPGGGYRFDDVCSIVSHWSNIESSSVTSSRMPQGAPLSSSEKSIISNWIAAGHRYDN